MRAHYPIKTEDIINALEETGGLVSLAAKKLKCSPKTIQNRAGKVHAVRQVIIDAQSEIVDDAELAVKAAVLRGEPWAVMLVLKTLGRGRGYAEKTSVELSGVNGKPLEFAVVERIVEAKKLDADSDAIVAASVRLLP